MQGSKYIVLANVSGVVDAIAFFNADIPYRCAEDCAMRMAQELSIDNGDWLQLWFNGEVEWSVGNTP